MDCLVGDIHEAAAFVDDLTVRGHTWQEVWTTTLKVLRRVTRAGFMINLNKCKFCVPRADLLGHEVNSHSYRLSTKFLEKQLSPTIPTTMKEL